MGRDDSWYEDDWRYRRRRLNRGGVGNISLQARRAPRSGAVTSVAVLNFIAGPLTMIVAFCAGVVDLVAQDVFVGVPGEPSNAMVKAVLALMMFGWAVGCLAAGVGLSCRAGWSRMFALLLGGFASLIGMVSVALAILLVNRAQGSGSGGNDFYMFRALALAVFFLGYCVWTYAALLNPRSLADFR